ncbi:helix-turn-helix domain-containing protein [Actinomadura sp. NBRC 104412]|uniref:helix-turn-helix domain-containing protein n=1 Tax=Actinomadura sp. NBRC 104412 TaxID=3032203 RepID=UPI0025538C0C|nr:helix-turn-helix domain-containing protein [Actinomadura sp. NBRC 104412]
MPQDRMPQRSERRQLWHPTREELDLERVLCALTDAHRRSVILALLNEPEGARHSYPWFELPVSKAGRTHHFRVLREAGLLRLDDLGNRVLVSLRRDDIEARFPGLLTAIAVGSRPAGDRPAPASADLG